MQVRLATVIACTALGFTMATGAAPTTAVVGQEAPAFSAVDVRGKTVSLADFKGKHVVLEWVNPGCPFVVKHYGASNMQATQKNAVDKGVVWLAVNSTAKDAGDYRTPQAMAAWMQSQKAHASTTLMDEDGKVGRAYGARTTPHMYIVNPQGQLIYAGGIDSIPSANAADIAKATNYIKTGLNEALAGKPLTASNTRPYGCSIKYKS